MTAEQLRVSSRDGRSGESHAEGESFNLYFNIGGMTIARYTKRHKSIRCVHVPPNFPVHSAVTEPFTRAGVGLLYWELKTSSGRQFKAPSQQIRNASEHNKRVTA